MANRWRNAADKFFRHQVNGWQIWVATPQAIARQGLEAEVIKVTEYPDIMKYNVMSTPGLVVNEKVVSSGCIPSQAEITTFLTDALTVA